MLAATSISMVILSQAKSVGSDDSTLPDGVANELLELALAKKTAEVKAKVAEFSVAQCKAIVVAFKELFAKTEIERDDAFSDRESFRRQVGNLLHPSVPIGKEGDDTVVHTYGPVGDNNRKKYSHVDLIEMIDGVDFSRGSEVAGNRGYFLKGPAVALEAALVMFGQKFLCNRDYTLLSPPVFMRKDAMQKVAQLSQFADELYKVIGKASEVETDTAVDEKFLIATAEQPIAAYHAGERIHPKALPIKYAGTSECFRQEVGSHGRDTRGIFRVHQFKKVEQFVISDPAKSWDMFEDMIKHAEDFCKVIGLSYRVVNIASGDLNLAAAKKHDLEAWFPGQGTYRELVSCSNCTDYQSRRLEIKLGESKKLIGDKGEHVHMLNSTLCATTRYICCILESFQVGDFESGGGIVVPEALRDFMPEKYREFLPFVAPPPPDPELAKAVKDAKKARKVPAKEK